MITGSRTDFQREKQEKENLQKVDEQTNSQNINSTRGKLLFFIKYTTKN